jgi:hypothetical protein
MIIGCDLHTRYQQIAMVDAETGELAQRRLEHEREVAAIPGQSLSSPLDGVRRIPSSRAFRDPGLHRSPNRDTRRKRPTRQIMSFVIITV